ncbi:MAG: hypothetical protein B2I17_09155 [Thermoplasmatales archaeon B_DKE]|nr:MAG: hypothetical protein B2I17_09155 [Thermoplasmatales archaeon B_DKE]
MSVVVKKLVEEDAEIVQEIATASWNFTYKGIYDYEYIEHWLTDHYSLEGIKKDLRKSLSEDGLLFLGAFTDSLCVGFMECKFSHGEADLLRLYVRPEKVGQGYGKALLQHAENLFVKHSIKKCILEVNLKNSRAIIFYKNFGFRITEIRDDDYLMVKDYQTF